MKIGFVLPGIPGAPTGGSKVVFEYCNWLCENGHDVSIYYLHTNFKKNPIVNILWKKKMVFTAKNLKFNWFKLNNDIKNYVVFSADDLNRLCEDDVTVITAVETFEITNSLNTPRIVYFIQDHENWGVSEDHLHYTYRSEMPKITIAKWLSDIVDQYSPVKSICIPDGIDSTIFYRTEQKKDKHSIVFHYRKAAYKGCDVALEVLDRLKQKYSDLKVYVVSNESIEDLPNWMIKRSQITPQEVAAINNNCEVFLCTSREEGYGLPGLEGMACGCALVSTSYAGVLEYAVDGLNSLLAPVDDVEKLENNIIIIFEDRELREKIVVQGMRTAEELSVDNAARKFEEVLKSRGLEQLQYP